MKNDLHMNEKKILTIGRQGIRVRHFTTDITNLPFVMDANCFMVFSHLWRRYLSACSNESLITEDDWFQFPMKSLQQQCGFKDKGTLQRAVEGLYRSGVVDVRVESGKKLWACWKMNKNVLEKIASIPDRYVMVEPYLKSITSIESKDKNFTYMVKKDGLDKLGEFFGVKMKEEKPPNIVENPPLFNTIIQQYSNTLKQHNDNTTKLQNNTTKIQQYDKTTLRENNNTAELEDNSTLPQEVLMDVVEVNKEVVNKEVFENNENQNESKSKIERNDDSNRFQPKENNLLSLTENKEVSMVFKTLGWEKTNLDSNTFNACLDLLHELTQSKADNYKETFAKVYSQFKALLEGYGKEDKKSVTKALNDLSFVLERAFRKKTSSKSNF